MPTGYTADIPTGIDFKTFAMNCARAMGACVSLRDERGGGEVIPDEFQPNAYYAEAVQKALARLEELKAMTPTRRKNEAVDAYHKAMNKHCDAVAEDAKRDASYKAMLGQVHAWVPPTPEHEGMKQFMVEQIEESIKFDSNAGYLTEPQQLSADEWWAAEMAKAYRDLGYAEKAHREEQERCAKRTAWIKALRESLS